MEFKDYYATLGVGKKATAKELKQAYRRLARKFHPDVNPGDKGAEARFKEVNEAYEVLGDPEKRRRYDELGANWRLYEQQPPQGGGPATGGFQWTDLGGRAAGGGIHTINADEMRRIFGDEDPFSEFFRTFFGGADPLGRRQGRGSRTSRARDGQDAEQPIELDLEEAFAGTTKRLVIDHGGQSKSLDVRIPAGVGDGARIRVAGEGGFGVGGGRAGDLFLRVRIRPHTRFERRDRDLYTRVQVPVLAAVLGGEAEVRTVAGQRLRLKVPPATQNGQVFRLKGHGMPSVGKPQECGDLYATIDVQVPRRLTAEQRKHYEALAKLEERT